MTETIVTGLLILWVGVIIGLVLYCVMEDERK